MSLDSNQDTEKLFRNIKKSINRYIKLFLFQIINTMFKFNFNQEESIIDDENDAKETEIIGNGSLCQKHEFKTEMPEHMEILEFNPVSEIQLKYVDSAKSLNQMKNLPEYLNENSDLVKNVYEGGLKIWECSQDLVSYLNSSNINLKNQRILELGCGAALPSLYCLKQRPEILDLQDFNPEVIEYITKPNCILNQVPENQCEIGLYSGDWADFLDKKKMKNNDVDSKYDLILTSETIYDESNYGKLISVFKNLLKKDGTILLAAKIHYFGVGGGLRSFEKCLQSKWTFRTVFENNDTVKREIIEIRRKN